MGEKILDWLQKIITGPKGRLFWVFVIAAIVIGAIVFPYIDANYLYYNRIEKRIDNLKALMELSGETIEESEALRAEYQSILQEIEIAREKALSNATNAKNTVRDRMIKFFEGAGLFYFVAVVVLFAKKKTEKWSGKKILNNIASMFVCVVIGSILGLLFALVPTLGYAEVNAIAVIIVEVIVLWLLIAKPQKKSATS